MFCNWFWCLRRHYGVFRKSPPAFFDLLKIYFPPCLQALTQLRDKLARIFRDKGENKKVLLECEQKWTPCEQKWTVRPEAFRQGLVIRSHDMVPMSAES